MGVREDFNRICLETKVEEMGKKKAKAEKLMTDVFGTGCCSCKVRTNNNDGIAAETMRDYCGLTNSHITSIGDRLADCPYKEYLV